MSVCQVFTEFRFIFVMHFKKKFIETETDRKSYVFFVTKGKQEKNANKIHRAVYTVPCGDVWFNIVIIICG